LIRVLYVGDAGALAGPFFFASPFIVDLKGFSVHVWAQPLIDALKKSPEIDVKHMAPWDAFRSFPKTVKEMSNYDVIIISDVEAETILFYPEFYTPSEYEKFIVRPNRTKVIKEYVENGGALVMAGSWFTFSGRHGFGGWGKTAVADILPVEILPGDDRVEAPEGVVVKAVNPEHPVMAGIPWDQCPPFLGYNKTRVKKEAHLLATIGDEEDPFIAVWDYEKGRVMAFTSDPCPHWGINFVKWEHYSKFWLQAVMWLSKKV